MNTPIIPPEHNDGPKVPAPTPAAGTPSPWYKKYAWVIGIVIVLGVIVALAYHH